MKKILILFLTIFIFTSCSNLLKALNPEDGIESFTASFTLEPNSTYGFTTKYKKKSYAYEYLIHRNGKIHKQQDRLVVDEFLNDNTPNINFGKKITIGSVQKDDTIQIIYGAKGYLDDGGWRLSGAKLKLFIDGLEKASDRYSSYNDDSTETFSYEVGSSYNF